MQLHWIQRYPTIDYSDYFLDLGHRYSAQMNLTSRLSQSKFVLILCLNCLFITSLAQTKHAADTLDTFDIKDGIFYLPQTLPKGKYLHALAIYYVVVPKVWALDNVNAPMLNYLGKYALTPEINLQGGISTLFVSNRINLGPFWNHSIGDFHVGIGYQVAFNYGILRNFGFNTVLTGWEQQPSIAVGYSFAKSAITLRGDLYYTSSLNVSEAGNVIKYNNVGFNGYSITPTLEQRLWKKRVMSFGVKLNYVRYHILAWPAFPVNRYRYVVPEFQIGLRF